MILLYFIDILLSSNILQVTFVLFFIIIFYNNSVFLSYMIFVFIIINVFYLYLIFVLNLLLMSYIFLLACFCRPFVHSLRSPCRYASTHYHSPSARPVRERNVRDERRTGPTAEASGETVR